ncbi:hypothetical protein ACQPXM_01135 [Kribbella sp. CA-253562]
MTTRAEVHRHRWQVASAHRVSDGFVVYRRCLCGRWDVKTVDV